jgi:DNA repair protein RadC
VSAEGTLSGPLLRELRIVYAPVLSAGPLPEVGRPSDAIELIRPRIEYEPVEVSCVLLLNTKKRLIGIHEIGRGTLDACIVHPRDVFKAALLANAAGVIVAHNHPSGDPTPSADDIALNGRLRRCAELIGVDLLDFLIVGDGRAFSFKESGL